MDNRRCKRTVPVHASTLARHEAERVAWAATDSATHANAARTLSPSLAQTTCVEMRRDCGDSKMATAAARQHDEFAEKKNTRRHRAPQQAGATRPSGPPPCSQTDLERNLVRLELSLDECERGRGVVAACVLGESSGERAAAAATAAGHLRLEQVGFVLGARPQEGRERRTKQTQQHATCNAIQHSQPSCSYDSAREPLR